MGNITEKGEGVVPIPEGGAEVTPETEETTTFTQEEVDAMLLEKDKSYQGIQKVVSKKDAEIQRLRKQTESSNPTVSNSALLKLIPLIEGLGGDEIDPARKQKLVADLQGVKQSITDDQWQQQVKTRGSEINNLITDASLDPSSKEFRAMRAYFKQGSFNEAREEAEEVVARLKEKTEAVVEPEKKPVKTEEEIRADVLKEFNLTPVATGGPQAAASTKSQARADYAAGEISTEEYERKMKGG